jgi:hypothetical protein
MNLVNVLNDIENKIFDKNINFDSIALQLFEIHYQHNETYNKYCNFLNRNPRNVLKIDDIPLLPVDIFKTQPIFLNDLPIEAIFETSGTTANNRGKHYVPFMRVYQQSLLKSFEKFFSSPQNYKFAFLLPNYLEQPNSSLVYMANVLANKSQEAIFFKWDYLSLKNTLEQWEFEKSKIILWGVSFALLEFAEKYPMKLYNTIVVETGGMKGRRAEMTRNELHYILKEAFGLENIASEYGMTELLSQAYSLSDGIFNTPPWMKVLIKDKYNHLHSVPNQINGKIGIIDLANLYSLPFIMTDDIGKKYEDGSFEVLGRSDYSTLRGCNLLYI